MDQLKEILSQLDDSRTYVVNIRLKIRKKDKPAKHSSASKSSLSVKAKKQSKRSKTFENSPFSDITFPDVSRSPSRAETPKPCLCVISSEPESEDEVSVSSDDPTMHSIFSDMSSIPSTSQRSRSTRKSSAVSKFRCKRVAKKGAPGVLQISELLHNDSAVSSEDVGTPLETCDCLDVCAQTIDNLDGSSYVPGSGTNHSCTLGSTQSSIPPRSNGRLRTSTGSSIGSSSMHTTSGQTLDSSTPASEDLSAFTTPAKQNKPSTREQSNSCSIKTALDDQPTKNVKTARLPSSSSRASKESREDLSNRPSKDVATAKAKSPLMKATRSLSECKTAGNGSKLLN